MSDWIVYWEGYVVLLVVFVGMNVRDSGLVVERMWGEGNE